MRQLVKMQIPVQEICGWGWDCAIEKEPWGFDERGQGLRETPPYRNTKCHSVGILMVLLMLMVLLPDSFTLELIEAVV